MDDARSMESQADATTDYPAAREPQMDPPPAIGSDERRMHVRAYKFWVSLLRGKPFPSIEGFDPAHVPDFGDHGVMLDFTDGPHDPAISYLGAALRTESGHAGPIRRISDVPGRSLLSRLTDHYLQIIANRAPIGFEAEFVNARGNTALYRGILMPFSADGTAIDHVYGVINWKELADARTALTLAHEVGGAIEAPVPASSPPAPAAPWADGPAAQLPAPEIDGEDQRAPWPTAAPARPDGAEMLADHLASARSTVDHLRSAEIRSRSALYRALGLAYDLSCEAARDPKGFAQILADAGLRRDRRARITAVIRLVFGTGFDRARLAEFGCVLAHGHRLGVAAGGLRRMLEGSVGGVPAIVAAERAARRTGEG